LYVFLQRFVFQSPAWGYYDADLAKVSPHVLIPERFALHLGTHLVSRYTHIEKAFITVELLRWTRIPVDNTGVNVEGQIPHGVANGHTHAFYRDGNDKRVIEVEVYHSIFICWAILLTNSKVDATAGKNRMVGRVMAGIKDLLGMLPFFPSFPKLNNFFVPSP
jgi:urate oxidase